MAMVSELRSLYRTLADDKVADYFLTDADYLGFLNEAQDVACISGDLIFDKSSSFCTLPVLAGTSIYTLDASLYGLTCVRLMDTNGVYTRLLSTTHDDLDRAHPGWREENELPTAFVQYRNSLELVPAPAEAYTLKLEGYRTAEPLDSDSDEPEIIPTLHASLNYWVLYRAYSSPDADLSNPRKAAESLAEFERVFGFRPKAANHLDKYANRPHTNHPSLIV
jgi:hypothetical protein